MDEKGFLIPLALVLAWFALLPAERDQANGQGERKRSSHSNQSFRYKHERDPDSIPQFGLVAEQVEKVNPDLVARDEQGAKPTPSATRQ